MAFRLFVRRSKKLGPFRLNLTKRGVGASVGVPGARYSVHSTGRSTKTVGIPGTGIHWRDQKRARRRSSPSNDGEIPPSWRPDPTRQYDWRWWSGSVWTDHVATGGVLELDDGQSE